MRRIMILAVLAAGFLGGAARAGVYGPPDPLLRNPPLNMSLVDIHNVIDPLRLAQLMQVPDQSPEAVKQLAAELAASIDSQSIKKPPELVKLATYYLRLGRRDDAVNLLNQADGTGFLVRLLSETERLEAVRAPDRTTNDRVRLGGCYIRMGRPNDAIRVLNEADQTNFLVLANLSAAYESVKELDRAVAYDSQALAAWPATDPGANGDLLGWYRRAEGYNLKLLRLRAREALANPANPHWQTMDALFEEPRTPIGDAYEAGVVPWKMWGDLPPDRYVIVSQLLVWLPNDHRLYWQLAEHLNTMGRISDASAILKELADSLNENVARELMRHRQVLQDAVKAATAFDERYQPDGRPDVARFQKDFHALLWALAPRGLQTAGGGSLPNEAGMAAWQPAYDAWWRQQVEQQKLVLQQQLQQLEQMQLPGGQQPPPPPAASVGWQADWRPIFVGFVVGVIVATLGGLQWTEWRRRRQAAEALRAQAGPAPSAAPPPTEPVNHDAGAFTGAPPAPDRTKGAS